MTPGEWMEAAAKARGISLEEFLRHGVNQMSNGGKPTPEILAEQASREAAEAKSELEKYRKEEQERRENAEKEAAAQRQAAFLHDFRNDLADAIDVNKHPILSASEDAEEVLEKAMVLADNYARNTGRLPVIDSVIDELESREARKFEGYARKLGYSKAQIQEELELAAAEGRKPAVDPAQLTDGYGDRDSQEPKMVRDGSGRFVPRVVSNDRAAARGAAPIDWSKLSERERIEMAGREVFGKGR